MRLAQLSEALLRDCRYVVGIKLHTQGMSVEEVATRMGRTFSTTLGYLVQFFQHERRTDPAPWVDAAVAQRIEAAVREVGGQRLKPIYEALGGKVPYEQIRIVMSCVRGLRSASSNALLCDGCCHFIQFASAPTRC